MPFGYRPDGDKVTGLSPTRAIMPFLFPTRTEALVYFEQRIDATRLNQFIAEAREKTGLKITVLHVMIAVVVRAIHQRPRLNRFVTNGRTYQRRGIWISYSIKTKKTDEGSLVALKRRFEPEWDLKKVFEVTEGSVGGTRAGQKQQSDTELALALALPTFMTKFFVGALRWLDNAGLLPRAMIDGDPLYASMFLANMGSIGMDAPFHHLYNWGNIPLFGAIGKEVDELYLDDNGQVHKRPMIPLRFTFDERVEDGLYCLKGLELLKEIMENPAAHFPI